MLDGNLAGASAKSKKVDNSADTSAKTSVENALAPLALSNVPIAAFFSIGFSHHTLILSKVKNVEARSFYIQLCADRQLSYDALERMISEDTYSHRGNMPNNFVKTMPDYKQAFRAVQMFKDEYRLDFINVEQLG